MSSGELRNGAHHDRILAGRLVDAEKNVLLNVLLNICLFRHDDMMDLT
jgi:hypothetical protein